MGGLGGDFCELLLLIILWLDVVEDDVEEDDEEEEGGGEFVIGTSSSLIPFSMWTLCLFIKLAVSKLLVLGCSWKLLADPLLPLLPLLPADFVSKLKYVLKN